MEPNLPRDKRIKFSERWRSSLDVNASGKPETRKDVLCEFLNAGLQICIFRNDIILFLFIKLLLQMCYSTYSTLIFFVYSLII